MKHGDLLKAAARYLQNQYHDGYALGPLLADLARQLEQEWTPTFLNGRQGCGEWLGAWPPLHEGDDWIVEVAHRDMYGKWTRISPGGPHHVAPPTHVRPVPPPPSFGPTPHNAARSP